MKRLIALLAAVVSVVGLGLGLAPTAQASYNGTGSTTFAAYYPMTDAAGSHAANDTYNNNQATIDGYGGSGTSAPSAYGGCNAGSPNATKCGWTSVDCHDPYLKWQYDGPPATNDPNVVTDCEAGTAKTSPAPQADTYLSTSGVTFTGSAASFNGTGRLIAEDSSELDPTGMTFSWGYSILIPCGTGYGHEYQDDADTNAGVNISGQSCDTKANVMQKGVTGSPGTTAPQQGLYKSEINSGTISGVQSYEVPTCSIQGYNSAGVLQANVIVKGKVSFNDNAWHSVKCAVASGNLSIYIDGSGTANNSVSTGSTVSMDVSGSQNFMTIGGKKAPKLAIDPHDTLTGSLKNVWVTTGVAPAEAYSFGSATQTVIDNNSDGVTDLGDTIVQTVPTTNTGKVNANLYFQTDTSGVYSPSTDCSPSVLPLVTPGNTVNCTVTHTVTSADVTAGQVSAASGATVGAYPVDGSPVYFSSPYTFAAVPVSALPGYLVLSRTTAWGDTNSNGVKDAGDTLTYTFTLQNTSSSHGVHNVAVNDSINGGSPIAVTTCPTSLAKNATVTCAEGAYTITSADVTRGKVQASGTLTANENSSNAPLSTTDSSTTNIP